MILCFSNEGGSIRVWQMTSEGKNSVALTHPSMGRIRHAFYSLDMDWLYVQPNHGEIYRLPLPIRRDLESVIPDPVTHFDDPALFLEEPLLSPDGLLLIFCKSNGGSSLWRFTLGNAR